MKYWIKLSAKHRSEVNNNFENSCFKSITFLVKHITFYNIPIKIQIFRHQNNNSLKYCANIRFSMFIVQLDRQKKIFSEIKILQCIQNDLVVNFNDVMRTAHCPLNIESTQSVAILTFELTL